MAEDIDINIRTTGDTSGAEAVQNSLFGVVDANKQAQMDDDVSAVKQANATKLQQEQAAALEQTAASGKALVALQLSDNLSKTVGMLRQLFPEGSTAAKGLEATSQAIGMVQAGLNTFIATGNPYAAVAATIASGIAGVNAAYKSMQADIALADRAQENFKANMIDSGTQHKELARSIRADNLAKEFQGETEAARGLSEELERQNRIAAAKNSLENARASAGGASEGAQAVQQAAQMEAQQERDLQAAREKLSLAEKLAAIQRQTVANGADQQGVPIANIEEANKKLHELNLAVESATKDLAAVQDVGTAAVAEAGITAAKTVQDGATDTLTKLGDDAVTLFQKLAAQPGAVMDEAAKQATAAVQQVMADGKVQMDEIGKLTDAIRQMGQSSLSNTQEAQKLLTSIVTSLATARGENAALLQRVQAMENQYSQLKYQISYLY